MATAAQLRARRLFVKRFGHKRKATRGGGTYTSYQCPHCEFRSSTAKGFRRHMSRHHHENHRGHHRRRNPEEGGGGGRSWLPYVLIGGAGLLLLRGNVLGSVLGGGLLGSGYTQVGTDSSGHPIYQGPVGSAPPSGYTQTGTGANGQPVFSYGGGFTQYLGIGTGVLGGIVSAVRGIFGGGGSVVGDVGSAGSAVGTAAGGLSDRLRDLTLEPSSLNLGNLSGGGSLFGDFSLPDLSLGFENFQMVPDLQLDLTPVVSGPIIPPDFWPEF